MDPAEEKTPVSESEWRDEPAPRRKRKAGCLPCLIGLTVLLVAGGVGLHMIGKLRPLLECVHSRISAPPSPAPPSAPVAPSGETQVPAPAEEPAESAAEKAEPATDEKVADAGKEAAYRAQFKPPVPGSAVTLLLKNGSKVQGKLSAVNAESVTVLRGEKTTFDIQKSDLTLVTRAGLYVDDFVYYRMALDKKRQADASREEQAVERLKAEHAAQDARLSAKQAEFGREDAARTNSVSRGKESVKNMSMKDYIEKTGPTDMAKDRQKRVQEHEGQ